MVHPRLQCFSRYVSYRLKVSHDKEYLGRTVDLPNETAEAERAGLMEALDEELRAFNAEVGMLTRAVAERLGVGVTDLQCLSIIGQAGSISAGRLAEMIGLTSGAITGVVDRLERTGYVRRERDTKDRRKVIIRPLSGKIERDVAPLFDSVRRARAELCSGYSDHDLAVILDFVTRNRPMLREEIAKLRNE